MNKKLVTFIIPFIVYLITTGISYKVFSQGGIQNSLNSTVPVPKLTAAGGLQFDENLPKTEPCPLNGTMYSKQQREWWVKHRPLGIMIENHEEARPQSGLSATDVIYEAVAEGSITRFLAVFYCQDAPIVGPVRSARTYFLDFISEYADYPLYAHVGGANTDGPADALGQIEQYRWGSYNDLSQFSLGCPVFCRDVTRMGREVATEHTMYSSTSKLWKVAEQRGLTNVNKDGESWDANFVPYTFIDDAALADRKASQSIHLELWEGYGQYTIDWIYDKAANDYKRSSGGKPHTDLNTKKQLTTKNVVGLVMVESHANDGYENNQHLIYKDKGTGKAYIFMNGQQTIGTWRKDKRTSRTLLFDSAGKQIPFVRGRIWFTILPTDGIITVK